MSQKDIKSPKHCAKQSGLKLCSIDKLYKRLFFLFISILSLVLLIWFILHPSKPHFTLKQAEIYQPNPSSHSLLNSSLQFTLLSKNPNQRVGIYYDSLQAHASYNGRPITVHASLPGFYQGHEDTNLLAVSLAAAGPSAGGDRAAERLVLSLMVNGRVRWKVGAWASGAYPLNVKCNAIMAFGMDASSGPLSADQGDRCSTSV